MAGPGSRQLVVAPQRRAPAISLLTAAIVLPENEELTEPTNPASARDTNVERWLNGIKYRPELSGLAQADPVGCITNTHLEEEETEADDDEDRGTRTSDPFRVWTAERCSTIGWSANEYRERAVRLLEATEAYRVEHEFWTGTQAQAGISAGVDYTTTQWLAQQTSCTVLNGGTATNVENGLGLLQTAIGDATGGSPGMIHYAPSVANFMLTTMLVTPIASNTCADQTCLVDVRGNRHVPGFGYSVNTGPDGSTPSAGTFWMYATDMVYIHRSPVVVNPPTLAQALVRDGTGLTNDLEFEAARYYLTNWDHAVHYAVLVNACNVCQ